VLSLENEIALIDNYIDDTVLTLFSKYPNLNYIIITKSTSKQLIINQRNLIFCSFKNIID
jgi:hypothetical protein